MNKIVIFMRHGKAADPIGFATDFERPLVTRGISEAKEAIIKLNDFGIFPDKIISSTALRTQQTAQAACESMRKLPNEYSTNSDLYSGSLIDYLNCINAINCNALLLIGHNPIVGQLAWQFSEFQITSFPTSSVAAFEFNSNPITLYEKAKLCFKNLRK